MNTGVGPPRGSPPIASIGGFFGRDETIFRRRPIEAERCSASDQRCWSLQPRVTRSVRAAIAARPGGRASELAHAKAAASRPHCQAARGAARRATTRVAPTPVWACHSVPRRAQPGVAVLRRRRSETAARGMGSIPMPASRAGRPCHSGPARSGPWGRTEGNHEGWLCYDVGGRRLPLQSPKSIFSHVCCLALPPLSGHGETSGVATSRGPAASRSRSSSHRWRRCTR